MKKPVRILYLEDNPRDEELVRAMLEGSGIAYNVTRVDSRESFKSALEQGGYDLIISDYTLPSFDGAAALELARKTCPPEIPFLYFSGTIGEDAAVQALLSGATDYVLKTNPKRLVPAVTRAIREAEQAREKKFLEKQFLQAQKMEAVGKLAGGIAHDFNNLLTIISGYADLVASELESNHPSRKEIDEIRRAAVRAASLTRQLLAFSRRQIFDLKVLDLNVVVSNMEKLLRGLVGEDIEFVNIQEKGLGSVEADHGQIEQVIMNLAVNARDAMLKGGKLVIETANTQLDETQSNQLFGAKPGRYVMLSISDTGCGMDQETLSHLFEPFFTTKEPGKGTGLGLSTAFGIVKQSGGYIWVGSAPGRGTTFRIYFPRVEEAAEPLGTVQPAARSLMGSETILLVEDEEGVRNLALRVLTHYGYRVLSASDGEQAIDISRQHKGPIHLMVTDIVMPRMSGGDLARELVKSHPDMRVLYLSGYSNNIVAHKGILNRGIHFLQKPFTPETLAQKIRQILKERKGER